MFGNLFGKAKTKLAGAASTALDAGNTDVREAMMASCALTAFADGDVSDDEIEQVVKQIEGSDQLKNIATEAKADFMKYVKMLETTGRMGKMEIMKEITDLANDTSEENKIRVVLIAIEVADSEGGIDDAEIKVIKNIASKLGIADQVTDLIG